MKRFLILLAIIFSIQLLKGQTYFAFPNDSATWNCLFFWNGSPNPATYYVRNYRFTMSGDTILKGKAYKKIYYSNDFNSSYTYCGGLREDSLRQIFFFPFHQNFSIDATNSYSFQNDTSEQLLYTFNNIATGNILPINSGSVTLKVGTIDSVLIGSQYRKRYQIQNSHLFGNDYWIEGIGSTKSLLSSFTYEFEWNLYTLCYNDPQSYFINSPSGSDSCHYTLVTGINDEPQDINQLAIFPNPVSGNITIETSQEFSIEIIDVRGQTIKTINGKFNTTTVDLTDLTSGVYFVRLKTGKELITKKIVKE